MLFSRRRSKIAIAGLSIYAVALAVAVTWFIMYRTGPEHRSADGVPENRYTGTILIPNGADGLCRRLAFDNNTGALRQRSSGSCDTDDGTTGNSTMGRMTAIRESFSKR